MLEKQNCEEEKMVIKEKTKELESETHFKDTFRVFSKDEEGRYNGVERTKNLVNYLPGCIPAEEMKFVLMPGKVTYKEIDKMIETVDKNGDGKISFSEFRLFSI